MRNLAENDSKPISHGHLSPNNILISNDGKNVVITDLGFLFLKKYTGLFGYSNKTQYTSVELLEEKGNVSVTITEAADVYSMGFIMWFVISGSVPFGGLDVPAIKNFVLQYTFLPI
jgi:serine/threonine protein kinase